MIWIIGGTSEAAEFIRIYSKKFSNLEDCENQNCRDYEAIVSVTTRDALEFFDEESIRVHVGKLDEEEMLSFIKENNIKSCVDLSHPHAKIVSENAKKICKENKVDYIRYTRKSDIAEEDGVILFDSIEDVFEYMKDIKATFLITTGVNRAGDFEKIRGDRRFIYRILPSVTSLKKITDLGVKMQDIVAVLGPVSYEFNKAMLLEYKADYQVLKDSGETSNVKERIKSAKDLSIKSLVIKMNEEEGFTDINQMVNYVLKKF